MAEWTSRSWFTSRLLLRSAHSSWRSCDIRGVNRGPPGVQLPDRLGLELPPLDMTANGLKLAENRRVRVNILEKEVGGGSLKNRIPCDNQKWNQNIGNVCFTVRFVEKYNKTSQSETLKHYWKNVLEVQITYFFYFSLDSFAGKEII